MRPPERAIFWPVKITTPPYPLTFCGGSGSDGGITAPSLRIALCASISSERLLLSRTGCGLALSTVKVERERCTTVFG